MHLHANIESLYNFYDEHLLYLFSSKLIKEKKYIRKLISISIDGYWDADASNLLQHKMRGLILCYPNLFISVLLEYSNDSIEKFWNYILYAPYPRKKSFESDKGYQNFISQIRSKICNKNIRIREIVDKSYNYILQTCEM